MASNNSSRVPTPPGNITNACEYLRNITLRVKKYLFSTPKSTYLFILASNGNSIPTPIDFPPALCAPLLAASIIPGPPPVITPKLASTKSFPSFSASL